MDYVDELKIQIKQFLTEANIPVTLASMRTCLNFIVENSAIMLDDYKQEIYQRILNEGR